MGGFRADVNQALRLSTKGWNVSVLHHVSRERRRRTWIGAGEGLVPSSKASDQNVLLSKYQFFLPEVTLNCWLLCCDVIVKVAARQLCT
jgi:hypothetical protein